MNIQPNAIDFIIIEQRIMKPYNTIHAVIYSLQISLRPAMQMPDFQRRFIGEKVPIAGKYRHL